MASQVPTGYNPEVSLLQGGTAPIVPVQGGGGMEAGASLPPGYNPDVSLLNTGQNAPIIAVKGGANGDTDKPVAYDSFVIEKYIPPLASKAIPPAPDKTAKQVAITLYDRDISSKLKVLESFTIDPRTYQSEGEDNPTYKRICPTPQGGRKMPVNFFQKIRRRIVTIEHDNPTIWLIHNLEGDLSKFLQTMELVPKSADGVLNADNFVIFTGSFFSPVNPSTTNGQLYSLFLNQKHKNLNNFFYLTSLTETFLITACNLLNDAYSVKTLTGETDKPVYPFYEPDILVFKKQQILLANGPLPVKLNPKGEATQHIQLSNILKQADPRGLYKDIIIVPTPGTDEDRISGHNTNAPPAQKYFKLDFSERKSLDLREDKKSVTCPKDESCQGFQGGYKLKELKDDKTLPGSGLYILRKSPDNLSFFATARPKAPEGPPKAPEGPPKPPGGPPKAPEGAPKAAKEIPKPPEEPSVVLVKPKQDTPFEADSSAIEEEETTIELNTREFRLRIPSKEVRNNWQKGKFTENETEFLNALQFSPTLLSETFGAAYWKTRLNEFLQSVVMSNCYVDTTLLTNIECSNAQEFMKQVYMKMFQRTLEQIYDEMGVPKPKVLSELIDEVSKLKQLGPTGGLLSLTKFEFTGDLLERFHKIYFDAQKGEYYYDFAELTDATREFLRGLKYFRVEDANVEEITKKILERMKIHLPPPGKGGPAAPPPNPPGTGSSSPPPPPPPPPASDQYTLDMIKTYTPIPETFFDNLFVKDDGLCFPRAILKALQPNPKPDSKSRTDTPQIYDPDEPTSLAFLQEIVDYIRAHKADIKVKNMNDTGAVVDIPVETYFDGKYKPKTGDVVDGTVKENGRIRVGTLYKKLSLDDYLNSLVTIRDPLVRPFAEVYDAGIGTAAAKLKSKILVLYTKTREGYSWQQFINEEMGATPQPLSSFIFLEWDNGNHYNVLKIAAGKTWPKPTAGGQILEAMLGNALEGEEVLDMGELVEDIVRGKTRKQRRSNKPRKQTRKHK